MALITGHQEYANRYFHGLCDLQTYSASKNNAVDTQLPRLHVAPARGADPPLGSDSARGLSSFLFTLPQLADQTCLVFRSWVKIWPIPTMLRELLQIELECLTAYLQEWNGVNRSV